MIGMTAKGYLVAVLCAAAVPGIALGAAVNGRDSLKGTTKTQGDFNVGAHHVRVEVKINGALVAGSPTVRGLERALQTTVRPPNHNPSARVSITLERAFSPNDLTLYNWRKAVIDGKVDRKSVSIIIHNDAGAESERLNFYECFPTKWRGPSLNARNSGHATEKLEIKCQSVRQAAQR